MNGKAMFFDSIDGDRIYDAQDFRDWMHHMFSEGVSVNDFFVSPAGGMSLTVPGGYVHIRGASKTFSDDTTVTLDAPDPALGRIDAVVLELDIPAKTIEIRTVSGAASETPTAPEIVRNDNVWQLVLAYVHVRPGAAEITDADVEDTRMDRNKCGYLIRSACDNDMAEVIAIYDETVGDIIANTTGSFGAWFESQKAAFSQDVASKIETISAKITAEQADVTAKMDGYAADVEKCRDDMNATLDSGVTTSSSSHVSSLYPGHWTTNVPNFDSADKAPSTMIVRIKIAKDAFAAYTNYTSYLDDFYVNVVLRKDDSNNNIYVGNFYSAVYENGTPVRRVEVGGLLGVECVYDFTSNTFSVNGLYDGSNIDIRTSIKSIYFDTNSSSGGGSISVIRKDKITLLNAIPIWSEDI